MCMGTKYFEMYYPAHRSPELYSQDTSIHVPSLVWKWPQMDKIAVQWVCRENIAPLFTIRTSLWLMLRGERENIRLRSRAVELLASQTHYEPHGVQKDIQSGVVGASKKIGAFALAGTRHSHPHFGLFGGFIVLTGYLYTQCSQKKKKKRMQRIRISSLSRSPKCERVAYNDLKAIGGLYRQKKWRRSCLCKVKSWRIRAFLATPRWITLWLQMTVLGKDHGMVMSELPLPHSCTLSGYTWKVSQIGFNWHRPEPGLFCIKKIGRFFCIFAFFAIFFQQKIIMHFYIVLQLQTKTGPA